MKPARLLLAVFLVGCTGRSEQKPDPATQVALPTPVPVCHPPRYLVRDLTVPWSQRTYLVASCDKPQRVIP